MRLLFVPLFLILEIVASIKLAGAIGTWATLAWLVIALFLGINLLRIQGAATLFNAAQEMRAGGQPGQALLDGLFKALAAILLIVPGIVSDILALLGLIPQVRRYLFARALSRWSVAASVHSRGFSSRYRGNVYEHDGPANDPEALDPDKLPPGSPRKGDD
jgi:UPF0716 protein FxsA